MYLFFDTETTGLPKRWNVGVEEIDNWPRLVQLAWIVCDKDGNKISGSSEIIKPDGFIIPKESERVHGISTEVALEKGIELNDALDGFYQVMEKAKFLVAHNISFDEKIMGAEFIRMADGFNPLSKKDKICTMKSATNYCQIPSVRGYKWPNLSELHRKIFGIDFEGAHDALADVEACARCFFELKNSRVL